MTERAAAFITGGTGALGRAVAKRLLSEGYRAAVTYRDRSEWDGLAREAEGAVRGGALIALEADVTDEASIRRAVDGAAAQLGGLRALVHVAGGYAGGTPVESIDAATVRGMLDLNLVSGFWAAKAAIPHVKRAGGGRLVFISSRGALEPQAGTAAYAASKAALHGLVGSLAKELREHGATVNAVIPGTMDTPANRASMPKADAAKWVRPEAVAAAIAFLVSEAAASITGALVPVYGRS